jgi:hypothetical protein
MRNSISKTIVAGLTALTLSAAVVLPSTPASAGWRMGGGGWGGGWHGGGWGGGWGGGGVWHNGYWRNGYWNNGWWGPALAAGLLTGAVIASSPGWGGYGYGYGGGNGCWQYRPTYDGYGHFLGQRWVTVC